MTKKIVVLGAGFGGAYTAMYLEKYLKSSKEPFEILIVNRKNYFVFQPMLAEVVGGSLGMLDTVNPIRKLLPKTQLYVREIERIDLKNQHVILAPKYSHTPIEIPYDHLVLGLGTVTDFRGLPGLHEHAIPFKNLSDSLHIRNQVIDVLETAANETNLERKKQLLTFVIGGGGFSGTEVVAEINDLVRNMIQKYPTIPPDLVRVVLIHSKSRLMDKEMPESLSRYAEKLLKKRNVEIYFDTHLKSATPQEAILDNGERIPSKTIISTVPSSPNLLIQDLELTLSKGKIVTDAQLLASGTENIWSLGDCASVPNLAVGGICPPTAQFAIRQAKILAHNIVATINQSSKKDFKFKALGMMGALGHHSAVAELFGKFKFSGILAWIMWRAIYWAKLPGFDRKIKVALSWILDTIIPPETVQMNTESAQGMAQLHFETGEIIFREGDLGDYLYIIVNGEVEIFKGSEDNPKLLGKLSKGEYFGEMALLHPRPRLASVKCITPVDVLAVRKQDFGLLMANFDQLKNDFEETEKIRRREIE